MLYAVFKNLFELQDKGSILYFEPAFGEDEELFTCRGKKVKFNKFELNKKIVFNPKGGY